jgi:hypothetical protein
MREVCEIRNRLLILSEKIGPILILRNAQGDSRWQAPACGLEVPDV